VLAGLLLVAGALAVGGAGLLEGRGRRTPALWTAGAGAAAIVAAVVVFVLRPSADVTLPRAAAAAAMAPAATALRSGHLQCTFDPARSRVTVSATPDVELDWSDEGCMNRRTQYVETGTRWERVLAPDGEPTVSILRFDPATARYDATRYYVSAEQMTAIRAARGTTPGACTIRPETLARLAERQSAIRALLPSLPNEKLSYTCRVAG